MRLLRNKSILCVDDDSSVRDIIVSVMDRAGYQIYCTGEPSDAFEAFCDLKPFLVLMDLVLENSKAVNGVLLTDRMKEFNSNCVFVALTGYLHNFDFGRLRQVFDDIYLKPVSQRHLYDVAQLSFERTIRWESYLRADV